MRISNPPFVRRDSTTNLLQIDANSGFGERIDSGLPSLSNAVPKLSSNNGIFTVDVIHNPVPANVANGKVRWLQSGIEAASVIAEYTCAVLIVLSELRI